MTNFYVSCRRRRQLGVGLSPAAPTKKSKSVAISASYPNLSTFRFPTKAARAAGYLPNDQRLISAKPSQSSRSMGLNDATNRTRRIGSMENSIRGLTFDMRRFPVPPKGPRSDKGWHVSDLSYPGADRLA